MPLVSALEPAWADVLDAVLRARRAPPLADVAQLGPKLVDLSRAYNATETDKERPRVPLDARIAFSFARDVPKGAGAVRELVATGALAMPAEGVLRVLDLGAGLGAMTWGVLRALAAAGGKGRIEATLVDDDAEALAAAVAIAKHAPPGPIELAITTRTAKLADRLPRADLVIVGQVLSELDRDLPAPLRAERHAQLVRRLLAENVAEGGSLVVVEPALRDRTRHLHAVRDLLAAGGTTIFAPCLHGGPCPALAGEGDWCHEDLAVDLPDFLVPLARAAGLRWQGLTFSYLVLRNDARTLSSIVKPGKSRLRVVSERIVTKGKIEVFGCTDRGERIRFRRLDREATDASAGWEDLGRGDVVTLDGEAEKGRLPPNVAVDVWRGEN